METINNKKSNGDVIISIPIARDIKERLYIMLLYIHNNERSVMFCE